MAEQRIDKMELNLLWLDKMLHRTWHSPIGIRTKLARAVSEGTLMYCSEIWAFGSKEKDMKKTMGRLASRIWGSPANSRLTINSLEAGFTDAALVTRIKRLKLQQIINSRESGILKLLFETRVKGKIIDDVMRSVEDMNLEDEHRTSFITNKATNGTKMKYALQLMEKEMDEKLKIYVNHFWTHCPNREDRLALTNRFFHHLRMDSFYDSERISWWKGLAAQKSTCLFCGEEKEESREHLLLECKRWNGPREAFLNRIILQLRTRHKNEHIVILLLGGKVEEMTLQPWAVNAVMAFLDVVRIHREIARGSL